MADTATNKVHFDLKNVHFAPMKDDGTYESPIALKGAISMDLSAQGDSGKLRADGTDYYVFTTNSGYEGDLNFAQISDEFRIHALGEELTETEQVLVENSNTEGKQFALLFEFMGDVKNRRHVLYKCKSNRPNISGENKENQREADTDSVTITASPLESGDVKASTTETTTTAIYDDWFKAVFIKGATAQGKSGK